jgi:(1->4)-alpha-D-glucan 1-alpha-D-glucosylmutase
MNSPRIPNATYRIQFSLGFRFADARDLVPYLHELGISDLYASPRFKARRGSSHGYDVADPMRVNSELGTEREFRELIQKLQRYQMGMLLDIVPNHMVASHENPWWMDVLENGLSSAYASYFDIDWHPATVKAAFLQDEKVILPILGDLYGNVLENQELSLRIDEKGFFINYWDARLPLDPKTYRPILELCSTHLSESAAAMNAFAPEFKQVMAEIDNLPPRTAADPRKVGKRQIQKDIIKSRLWDLYHADLEFKQALDQTLRTVNGTKGDPRSFDLLDRILSEQAYRLAYWKIAYEEINYRRFFDINDLVGLRVELPQVFEARHAQIFNLIRSGQVTGLRIDHIDGLWDPADYLQRVQAAARSSSELASERDLYVVVEKILIEGETLPKEWPVCGTTGYDFLNALNRVFADSGGLKTLTAIYERFTGCSLPFEEICYRSKKQVIRELFAGEVQELGHNLGSLAALDRRARDVPQAELIQAMIETTACLRVYRTYVRDAEVTARDRACIESALEDAEKRTPESVVGPPAFAFLRRLLLHEPPHYLQMEKPAWLKFVMRWQQFTGPVMAKGFEDTALYAYPRLTSFNDVGGSPGVSEVCLEDFHSFLKDRHGRTPGTLNATSTHDSKRSEDVRARINVLSEIPREWDACLRRWSRWNEPKKRRVQEKAVPDRNEEILLYQTLAGAWPLDEEEVPSFRERVVEYMIKAAREAKINSNWLSPHVEHEEALINFVQAALSRRDSPKFLKDFRKFHKRVAQCGASNSLAQVLLKIAAPGVPDFYQGNELWDFSLVDPDNRRPVDFRKRAQLLEEIRGQESEDRPKLARRLLGHWEDGRIKLFVTFKSLEFRKAHADLFLEGDYLPLEASGLRRENVCAFARRRGDDWAVVIVPRLVCKLTKGGAFPIGKGIWETSKIVLPEGAPQEWMNVFTGETFRLKSGRKGPSLLLHEAFRQSPLALLAPTS